MTLPNQLTGEEEYFFEKNQELLKKRRAELDKERALKGTHEHWMKCPKCGEGMQEEDMLGIMIDKCTACKGIYFDNGELETLLSIKEHQGFFSFLKRKLN